MGSFRHLVDARILQNAPQLKRNPREVRLLADVLGRKFSAPHGLGASKSSFATTPRHAVIKSATSRSSTLRSPSYSPRLRTE